MGNVEHPFDTNDFEDLPEGVVIYIPLVLQDRICAVCGDVHHCTIANAITRQNVGIIALGRRGVSRRFVGMYLDRRVFPWAEVGKVYRGRLTDRSAQIAIELDELGKSPRSQESMRRTLRKLAATAVDGEMTVFDVIEIVAPYPSEKKGYRSGAKTHGRTGAGTKAPSAIPRREWKRDIKQVPAAKKPLKKQKQPV